MITDPERLDLSSASGAWRRRLCTGSENLIRELRAQGSWRSRQPIPARYRAAWYIRRWAGEEVVLNGNETLTLEDLVRLETLVSPTGAPASRFI
jgi:hypothetical protein